VWYIAVRIGDFNEAQDLASEVFVKALRAVESYRETGAPMEAWLFKIAHNSVVDHLRKKGRRPSSVPVDEALPLASTHDPTENLERQQEVGQMYRALSQLSKAQQQVLALRFGAEMTSEQAAEVLGKKPGAVREMQSAAIKKLREILKSEPA
jgi:RNA polymerase sigma-70 factor (ECF subfamily)